MARPNLKKTIANYSKANDLFLQRTDNKVYISDGYTIITVPVPIYETYFCPTSPRFPFLSESQKVLAHSKKELPTQDGVELVKLFPKWVGERIQRLKIAIVISISDSYFAEVFRCGKELIYLNSKYVAIAHEMAMFCGQSEEVFNASFDSAVVLQSGTPKSSPVIWNWEDNFSMTILPVNRHNDWVVALDGVDKH